jgi:PKD repeat protein
MQILKTMKKIFNLALALSLILFSCERAPEAHFSTDTIDPEVGQEVFFNNESHNAVDFEWDFGDGYVSNDPNPSHIYTGTGSFEVVMTAYSRNGQSDKATITINIMIPTLLEIEVLEYYQEYTVAGASVILYPTLPDWENQTNKETEGYTDDDGIVVFSHLGPYVYYVDVWEETHDNWTLKKEDIAFIRTDEIIPHKINRFTAWVDIADHSKSGRTGARPKVVVKLERKAETKTINSAASATEDWQTLYQKSVKLR